MAGDTIKAAPPFASPDADLILRSDDGVDFYVRQAILQEASSVFADMLVVGKARARNDLEALSIDDISVVALSEDSTVLDVLLRFIYPVTNPTLQFLEVAIHVLSAVSKYMIDYLEEDILKQLRTLATKDPMQAYALACVHRREDATRIAAKACLLRPCPNRSHYTDEMEKIIAGDFIRLQQYHFDCSKAAVYCFQIFQDYALDDAGIVRPWGTYTHHRVESLSDSPDDYWYEATDWWKKSIEQLGAILQKTPHPDLTLRPGLFAEIHAQGLNQAKSARSKREAIATALNAFANALTVELDTAISEVNHISSVL